MWLSHKNWQNVKSSEIYINILIPSYTGALETGWIEPSKTESDNSKWTSNFKEQAIGYESLFKVLYAGNYKVNGIFSYGYWWSDQMYPVSKDLRNDLIQTIRHKDAESVFYKWSKILA
jgi:hypothetical protein